MPERFAGRTVLVTGAGGGIGGACALRMAEDGAHVVCADIDGDAASRTAMKIAEAGFAGTAVSCDVADPAAGKGAVEKALGHGGRLDLLVNVAGVGRLAPTNEVTIDEWNQTIAVNLTGTFLMCQHALPALLETKGSIVNIASVAGVRAVPYNAAYCASKGGVVMLTKSLAVEYGGQGVRVNCVCPSSVSTSFLDDFAFSDAMDLSLFARGSSVIRGAMEPSVVAAAVAYLASDDAAMITGTALMLDGGATS